jgi:uncharacterized protein
VPNLTGTRMTRLLLLATVVSLAGCFSLSRDAPPQQHYVLGAGGPPERAAAAADRPVPDSSRHMVGLRTLRLADYLASPFIVVRRGAHQVEFSEYHRWGEDLGRAINRDVAVRLAALVPTHQVQSSPWPAGTAPELVVQVHVLRFEGVTSDDREQGTGEAHLLATWEILDPRDGAVRAHGTTEVRQGGWSVGDFDGLVRLLSSGLETLAEELALGLERALALREPTGPPPSAPPSLTLWR